MSKLSIEKLKMMRQRAIGDCWSEGYISVFDELIAIRELKGDQVPYGYVVRCHHDPAGTGTMIKAKELDYYKYRGDYHYTELFTAPQKPVPDELREDILRCVDDSMHGCNSLSASDYAVRVAGWLAAGGVVKDGE